MDDKDLVNFARLLRGENRASMTPDEAAAIGDTVLNRRELEGFPDTIEGVLTQRHQFHPFSPKQEPRALANAASTQAFGPEDPRWVEFMTYAQHVLNPDRPRSPYTHYFSGEEIPPWAKSLGKLTKIGAHRFGVEKRKKKVKP